MNWDTNLCSPSHKRSRVRPLPHPSTYSRLCFVEIMYLEKLSPVFCLRLGPLSPSNCATYSWSLHSPFSNGTLSLREEILAIGARLPAVFTAAKSCSEVWFPIPDSYGQGIKAPVEKEDMDLPFLLSDLMCLVHIQKKRAWRNPSPDFLHNPPSLPFCKEGTQNHMFFVLKQVHVQKEWMSRMPGKLRVLWRLSFPYQSNLGVWEIVP